MIAWKYIDKNAFAISAIRDYNSMKNIIEKTPEGIKEVYNRLINPAEAALEASVNDNVYRCGSKVEKAPENIDLIKDRYDKAREYMGWFMPAWTGLTKRDQKILQEYYMTGNLRSGASIRLQHELNYSERQIDRMRASALEQFSLLLLGE